MLNCTSVMGLSAAGPGPTSLPAPTRRMSSLVSTLIVLASECSFHMHVTCDNDTLCLLYYFLFLAHLRQYIAISL